MATPVLQIFPDIIAANVVSPVRDAGRSLFSQDPRFKEPGVKVDRAALRATEQNVAESFKEGHIRARRPMRGIQIKEDTFMSIRIIADDGTPIFQIDSGGEDTDKDDPDPVTAGRGRSFVNTNFIAQSVQEERVEKSQILETFGEPFVFFFGERPRFVHVGGFLLNTADFNWRAEWWENYEKKLRGTKLVERRAKVFLTWDDIVVVGYILNATAQDAANEPYRIPLTFSLYITNYFNIGIRGKVQVGATDPLAQLQRAAAELVNTGPASVFNKVFTLDVRDKLQSATRVLGGVKAALNVTRNVRNNPKRLFDAPADLAALSLLLGGGRPKKKFGPLRDNFDEFLGTELDQLDIPRQRFAGLSQSGFIQRLINFVPTLNDAKTLTATIRSFKRNKGSMQAVTQSNQATGKKTFLQAFTANLFGSGSGSTSSPYLNTNKARLSK